MKTDAAPKRALALLAILPLVGWWLYGLFDLDEGYYAAIVSEMNRKSEWITPYFNGKPWFEKPILLYWCAKPCLALFGEMVGPRLPSVAATLATYAVVGWFAERRLGPGRGVRAVLVMGSSLLVVGAGRMMLTDPLLVLAMTCAYVSYWESIVADWRWRIGTAIALGFAVLAKGPVAGLLFLPVAAFTAWRFPEMRPAMRKGWLLGTVALLLVVASWYVPAYLVNGHLFVQKFLIEQNFGRFTGGDAAHTVTGVAGLLFYVIILLVGMAPWSFRVPTAWKFSRDEPVATYLKCWALTIFVFFTISGAKLPHYILPACPALALLIADEMAYAKATLKGMIAWTCSVAMIANGAFLWWYQASGQSEIHALARYVRDHAGPADSVAEYEMGSRKRGLGSVSTGIRETSEPSSLLYLNRDATDTDDWPQIASLARPVWIITRPGRIDDSDLTRFGSRLQLINGSMRHYRLYRLN